MEEIRRLRAPWHITDHSESDCYSVEDVNGQNIAYVYYSEDPGRRQNLGRLTKDEAQNVAIGIARLPVLLVNKNT
jgi:hypothetical protein